MKTPGIPGVLFVSVRCAFMCNFCPKIIVLCLELYHLLSYNSNKLNNKKQRRMKYGKMGKD